MYSPCAVHRQTNLSAPSPSWMFCSMSLSCNNSWVAGWVRRVPVTSCIQRCERRPWATVRLFLNRAGTRTSRCGAKQGTPRPLIQLSNQNLTFAPLPTTATVEARKKLSTTWLTWIPSADQALFWSFLWSQSHRVWSAMLASFRSSTPRLPHSVGLHTVGRSDGNCTSCDSNYIGN